MHGLRKSLLDKIIANLLLI